MEHQDFTAWLLAAKTPSIRYLTLRDLLGRPEADPDVQTARQEIMTTGPVPEILSGQTGRGDWAGERSYYTPKYVSAHWSMLLLAELAAGGQDARLQLGANFMLEATAAEAHRNGQGLSCFWGNLLRYAVHCRRSSSEGRYGADPRLAPVIEHLEQDAVVHGWRCPHNAKLPCAWGAARAVWGLAALPASDRTPATAAAIEQGLAFLLDQYSPVTADYPTPGRIHSMWGRMNFPLFYQADIPFVLRASAELGALDRPGARAALEWLAGRRDASGRWHGASPYRQRTWRALGDPKETDRWVSLQAAIVLARAVA